MHQARLHGVEIDQGHRLTGFAIEQHVVDLGIAVDRPHGKLTALLGPLEQIAELFALANEADAALTGFTGLLLGVHQRLVIGV